jgi:ribonuclease HII
MIDLDYLRTQALVGVDEVGRGSWAGPILAAAVAVPPNWQPNTWVRDSKTLSPKKREMVFNLYENDLSLVIGVGEVDAKEIDIIGIDAAQAKAQALAVRNTFWRLAHAPIVIVDGVEPPDIRPPEVKEVILLPKGDSLIPAISLASIVAKVIRDRIMAQYEKDFPGYDFAKSSGYGTVKHREGLAKLGVCGIHRLSYRPVAQVSCRPLSLSAKWSLEMLEDLD